MNDESHTPIADLSTELAVTASSGLMQNLILMGFERGIFGLLTDGDARPVCELSDETGLPQSQIRRWAEVLHSRGFISWDPAADTCQLAAPHAWIYSPQSCIRDMFTFSTGLLPFKERRDGQGVVGHGIHDRSYRLMRMAQLPEIAKWIEIVVGKNQALLNKQIRVADLFCGHGASAILMAQRFTQASVVGYDPDLRWLETAELSAAAAGVRGRVEFLTGLPGHGDGYDLITVFGEILHQPNAERLFRAFRAAIKPGGYVLASDLFPTPGSVWHQLAMSLCALQGVDPSEFLGAESQPQARDLVSKTLIGSGFQNIEFIQNSGPHITAIAKA